VARAQDGIHGNATAQIVLVRQKGTSEPANRPAGHVRDDERGAPGVGMQEPRLRGGLSDAPPTRRSGCRCARSRGRRPPGIPPTRSSSTPT
jgi:hypothetical protein